MSPHPEPEIQFLKRLLRALREEARKVRDRYDPPHWEDYELHFRRVLIEQILKEAGVL